ncbi:hypothetical protein DFQ26_009357 [Actinomortierella ambigua]|nr:hypothetical protein DFQ26_009357 [Actinomortierella ambigua]
MSSLYAFCLASDDQHVYAAVFDKPEGGSNLILLRSQAHPPDLQSVKWEKLADSKFEHAKSTTGHKSSCATTSGAFLVLFGHEGPGFDKTLSGAYYDTNMSRGNGTVVGHWDPVGAGEICSVFGCEGKVMAIPGSQPPRFSYAFRDVQTNNLRFATFRNDWKLIGMPFTFSKVPTTLVRNGEPYPSVDFLVDYLSPQDLAFIMIEVVETPEKKNSITYFEFGIDDRGFPIGSQIKSNYSDTLPVSCEDKGTFSNVGTPVNGEMYHRCRQKQPSGSKEQESPTFLYSLHDNPARQVVKVSGKKLLRFLPVPAAGGANATWAIEYDIGAGIYGFHLSGPRAGEYFTPGMTPISLEGKVTTGPMAETNDSGMAGWAIGLIVAGCVLIIAGLIWFCTRRRRRVGKNAA